MMNVIVIGLGSMGKRRIRLIKKLEQGIQVIGVDSREDRRKEVKEKFDCITFSDLNEALKINAECAFVCTPPLSHAFIIKQCLVHKIHVFTEINLVNDGYDDNINLAKQNGVVLFLSSTFLYRDEVCYIQKKVASSSSTLTYNYHIGQYLPDWHPWEDYTDYFVGNSRTNGCREIMAIDFPWLYRIFGKVKDIQVKKAKKTTLKTTYNDSYLLLLEHENGIQGTVIIDVVCRKAVRNFEVFGEDLYISWDGSAQGLRQYDISKKQEKIVEFYNTVDKQDEYAAFVVENAYKSEIVAFFDAVKNKKIPKYGFEEDKYILGLIDKIEA